MTPLETGYMKKSPQLPHQNDRPLIKAPINRGPMLKFTAGRSTFCSDVSVTYVFMVISQNPGCPHIASISSSNKNHAQMYIEYYSHFKVNI